MYDFPYTLRSLCVVVPLSIYFWMFLLMLCFTPYGRDRHTVETLTFETVTYLAFNTDRVNEPKLKTKTETISKFPKLGASQLNFMH